MNGKLFPNAGLLINGQPYISKVLLEEIVIATNPFFQQVAMYAFEEADSLGVSTVQYNSKPLVNVYEFQQMYYDLSVDLDKKTKTINLQSRSLEK